MSIKKVAMSTCCLLLAASSLVVASCGGSKDPDANKTKIYVELKSGGTGVQWLVDAGNRFTAKMGNHSYEDGKEGVVIVPVPVPGSNINTAETSGTAIYDLENMPRIENYANKVLCIDDMMRAKSDMRNGQAISPADKISEDQLDRYLVGGKFYGAPTCEYYPTISYDKNLFDKYGLYLANPDAIENEEAGLDLHESEILAQDYYFVKSKSLKSCGPDGTYNTEDDGMPSSILELIALCEYMKGKGIAPFNFTGGYDYYSNFLPTALFTALQGYEVARSNYTFDGEIEIVTGMTSENLFAGYDGIKKPTTKKVTVTEETGYYTTWKIEKYYAEAFVELCVKNNWFGPSATNGDDQKAAMSKFVFSDYQNNPKIGMLLDGSYWYNEATEGDNYFQMLEDQKYLVAGQGEERDVRVMPLPVNMTESVEEGEGKPQTLLEMNYGMFVLNKNLETQPGLMQASLDFLSFLYTDAELSAYTASTSILRSMNYELNPADEDKISSFGKNLIDVINTPGNKVLYFAGNNNTFKTGMASFSQGWSNAVFGLNSINSIYKLMAIESKTNPDYASAEYLFKAQSIDKTTWEAMYKGNGTVTAIDGLTALTY